MIFRRLNVLEMNHTGKIWHVVTIELSCPSKTLKSVFFFVDRMVFKKVHLGHRYWFEISIMKIM